MPVGNSSAGSCEIRNTVSVRDIYSWPVNFNFKYEVEYVYGTGVHIIVTEVFLYASKSMGVLSSGLARPVHKQG